MDDWKPLKEMPIGIIGQAIDLAYKGRMYTNITPTGIRLEHEVVVEGFLAGPDSEELGRLSEKQITTFGGEFEVDYTAEWRHHV